jgi:AsmA family protein
MKIMQVKLFFRWAAITLAIFFLFLIVLATTFGIRIGLTLLKKRIESTASQTLNRTVSIDGSIEIIPSFWPTIEINDIRIKNPDHWRNDDFARIKIARVQLGILPLIRGKIQIHEFLAEGVTVQLEKRPGNEANWTFDKPNSSTKKKPSRTEGNKNQAVNLESIEKISIRKVVVKYNDLSKGNTYEFEISEFRGHAPLHKPLKLRVEGLIQNKSYHLSLTGGTLRDLFMEKELWNFQFDGKLSDASLSLRGSIDTPINGKSFDLSFKLSGDRLEDVSGLFGLDLPNFGSYELTSNLEKLESDYKLSGLNLRIGESRLSGNLGMSLSTDRPKLTGELVFANFDSEPFLSKPQKKTLNNRINLKEEIEGEKPFPLDFFKKLDADFDITMNRIVNLPVEIKDASIKLELQDGFLRAPISVNLADATFNGNFNIDTHGNSANLNFKLAADNSNLTEPARFLGLAGVIGSIYKFEFSLSSNGYNTTSFLENLDFKLKINEAKVSRADFSNGHKAVFNLENAEISLTDGNELFGNLNGSFLKEPYKITFTGCGIAAFDKGERCPIDLSASGSGSKLNVKGNVSQTNSRVQTDLNLDISGNRIGNLASWIGVSSSAEQSYRAKGKIILSEKQLLIESVKARIGLTTLWGSLGWNEIDKEPLFFAALKFDELDFNQLNKIFSSEKINNKKAKKDRIDINIPILPKRTEFDDADFDITINRLIIGPGKIQNVFLSSRMRDGKIEHSTFQANIDETLFRGNLSVDLRGDIPRATLNSITEKADIGTLLDDLNIAKGIEFTARRLVIDVLINGSSLSTILEKSELSARLEEGKWILHDPNTNDNVPILIKEGLFKTSVEKPTTLTLDGSINDTPVKIEFLTGKLGELMSNNDNLPIVMNAEAAGSYLKMKGEVELPIERNELNLKMSLNGQRIDSLDKLLGLDLPQWGPYEIGGQFRITNDGYYISDLDVRIGQSDLKGNLSLVTKGIRPRLDVDLATNTLQINDFDFGNWSPLKSNSEDLTTHSPEYAPDKPQSRKPEIESYLNHSIISSLDGEVFVKVDEVISGKDKLGDGRFKATLEDGKLTIDPFQINIPGGELNMTIALKATETESAANVIAHIHRFDYGVFARRINPDIKKSGLISLNLDLQSRAKNPSSLKENASGNLSFAVWPEDFGARIFDLWAVSLLTNLLPKWGGKSKTKINCILGDFKLEDGLMETENLLIDTTNVRAEGEGTVDFKTNKLNLVFKPRPKRSELFNLGVPIRVSGTLPEFKIRTDPHNILWFFARIAFFVYDYTLQIITQKVVPLDGHDVCANAM